METRIAKRTRTEWTADDRTRAYGAWRDTDSLAQTAKVTDIPLATVSLWCNRERWVHRRAQEQRLEQEMALGRAWTRIVRKADALVDDLLDIAHMGTKDDAVRLKAILSSMAIIGIQPRPYKEETRQAPPPERGLSMEETKAIEAIFTPQETDGDDSPST